MLAEGSQEQRPHADRGSAGEPSAYESRGSKWPVHVTLLVSRRLNELAIAASNASGIRLNQGVRDERRPWITPRWLLPSRSS
jgi:hypothetical protein